MFVSLRSDKIGNMETGRFEMKFLRCTRKIREKVKEMRGVGLMLRIGR